VFFEKTYRKTNTLQWVLVKEKQLSQLKMNVKFIILFMKNHYIAIYFCYWKNFQIHRISWFSDADIFPWMR